MKKTTKKLTLKKTTVKILDQNEKRTIEGGSRRACSNTACASFGCCQETK
ncbi:MAG: hypothetical protein JNM68_06285 [Dinghuibacter sp.]|nr:hypothetical protein [Dinghuibacter sp.]